MQCMNQGQKEAWTENRVAAMVTNAPADLDGEKGRNWGKTS